MNFHISFFAYKFYPFIFVLSLYFPLSTIGVLGSFEVYLLAIDCAGVAAHNRFITFLKLLTKTD